MTRGLDPTWEISPQQLRVLLDIPDNDILLLDCRRDDEVQRARIENSIHIPMDQIESRLPDIEEHENRPIVVYCHHGVRSLKVASFLKQRGFEDVRSLAGGIDAWSEHVDPSVPRYVK